MASPPFHAYVVSFLGSLLLLSCSSGGGGGGGDDDPDITSPTAEFTATPRAGVPPLMIDFTDQSSGGVTTWSWTFGDGGTSNLQNPSYTYAALGTYSVSLTVTDAMGTDSEAKADYISVMAMADVTSPVITCPVDQSAPGFVTDDFDGSSLDGAWSVLHPALLALSVSGGQLHLQPTAGGPANSWFGDEEGPAVLRLVTGDFTATATLSTEDPNNPGQPPLPEYRLTGVIARNPAGSPGNRNTVHVALGAGTFAFPVAVEDKNTVDSTSNLMLYDIPVPGGDVRIVRTGSLFSCEYRPPGGGAFQVLRTHNRPDLPATLQIGPMINSNEPAPDIRAQFESITVASTEAVVTFPSPTAVDDTDPSPVVVCSPPSGSSFPVGDTMVNCTATDASGNTANCSFMVTVTAPAPLIAEPSAHGKGPRWDELFLQLFPYPARGERPAASSTLEVRRRN